VGVLSFQPIDNARQPPNVQLFFTGVQTPHEHTETPARNETRLQTADLHSHPGRERPAERREGPAPNCAEKRGGGKVWCAQPTLSQADKNPH
jgi:hypothetical protein